MELTGLTNSTVSRWLNILRTKPNLVYIDHWARTGKAGNPSAFWAAGFLGEDAPRPAPESNAVSVKKWRDKKKKSDQITLTPKGLIHVAK